MDELLFSSDSESDLEVLAELSDLDSSDENEQVRRAAAHRRVRVNYIQTLDDAEFILRFRLSKPAVESLLSEIMPVIRVTSSRNHGVPPLHQLLVTLRFYALGTMLKSVADFVGVSKSTAGRIVRDISPAIASLYDRHITMHLDGAQSFYETAQFPKVLGVVDCTHVPIQSPSQEVSKEFKNHEGHFSLKVQAVCDANLRLMNVDAGWPGSTHDATIFDNSILRAQGEAGHFNGHWLLGDNAYPTRPYLLTPLRNPCSHAEHRYNEAHRIARSMIERMFSVWKHRFPVLGFTLRVSLPTVQAIVVATGVLHNICTTKNIPEVPPEVDIVVNENSYTEPYPQAFDSEDDRTRTDLIENFFS